MARMYSRKRGKSGSVKPSNEKSEPWMAYSSQEIEQLIVKIAKLEKTASQIGIELRDRYGIPNFRKYTNKRITKILDQHKLSHEIPDDLSFLIKKQINLTKHIEQNKRDKTAKRGLIITESKIRRLVKYYRGVGRLPQNWRFVKEQAELLVG